MIARRRSALGGACAAGLVAASIVAGAMALQSGGDRTASAAPEHATTTVSARTLTETKTFAGTLGHGTAVPLDVRVPGTVTWLPRYGDVIGRDGVLARIDERPVRAMHGAVPLWRTLTRGLQGTDVRQLTENLTALGYTGASGDRFGAGTAAAVRAWQRDRELPVTGMLDASQIAFVDGDVRVAALDGQVGGPTGDLYGYTTTRQTVTVEVPVADAARFPDGAAVSIGFGGTPERVDGRVRTVDARAGGGSGGRGDAGGDRDGVGGGDDTVTVTVDLDGPVPAGVTDAAGVDVSVAGESVADALSVPVSALVATRPGEHGDYVVEVVTKDGGTRRVPVRLGFSAAGLVEVRGPVHAGDHVVVPT